MHSTKLKTTLMTGALLLVPIAAALADGGSGSTGSPIVDG